MRLLLLLCTTWLAMFIVYGGLNAAEIGWNASGKGGAVAAGGKGAVAYPDNTVVIKVRDKQREFYEKTCVLY